MVRGLLFWGICCVIANPALAGAWLREKGKGFVAASATGYWLDSYLDYKSSVYAEWGVLDRLTLGLDVNEHPGLAGHALLFGRVLITSFGDGGRIAAEIGIGAHHWSYDWYPMYKATLSYGKGLETRWGNGWMGLDAAYEMRSQTNNPIYKLDFTIGLSTARRIDPMLQIETSYVAGNTIYWTLTPSVIIDAKRGKRWVIGVEHNSTLPDTVGLKLGLWRDF